MRLEAAAFLVAAVSFAEAKSFKLELPSASVTSVSVAGRKLLSQARRLPEEEEYNNYYNRDNQNWRYSEAQSEYAQQYKSNNQQQYQQYQQQNQQQNKQDDDDGYKYSGYSSNAQSNVGDYMNDVRYYTGTRDSNWHFNSGRTYNYGGAYGYDNMGSYRNGAYDQGAYSAYNGMSGSWGASEGSGSDTSWMSEYSIKFNGCATDYRKDSGETNTQLLAKFKLCPNASGASCRHSGDYVVPMEYFVEAYETIATTDENCRIQQGLCGSQCGGYNRKLQYSAYGNAYSNMNSNNAYGNSNNQNGNDAYGNNAYSNANQDNGDYYDEEDYDYDSNEAACFDQCMEDAGMGYCSDSGGRSGYGMDIRDMIQCRSLETYTDGSQPYWVGASCRDGGVFIDLFADSFCRRSVDAGSQETILGFSLPENNLVSKGLVSCTGYMRDNQDQYSEGGICQGLYADAGKCERHMKGVPKKHTGGCSYIRHLNAKTSLRMAGIITAIVLMTACITMAAYVYHLMRQGQDAQQAMRSIYISGKDRMASIMPTVPSIATGKSLSQPLAPTDDSKTVVSGSSEESGGYQGAKMSADVEKSGDV